MDTETWNTIDVYCRPVGVAYRGDEIVGFCAVNDSVPIPCVSYFKVSMRDGVWTDISRRGLCSYSLSTTNLTNPVILQYVSQIGHSVKLYIAEQGTSTLHEIDLGEQESETYDYGDHDLKIDRLVPAIANNGSFIGIRIELSTNDFLNGVVHSYFSSTTQSFSQSVISTETVAFNSYNLTYLVSFTANLRTLIVFEGGTTRQYSLVSTVDDPSKCKNMIGPDTHYLICLAQGSHGVMLINVTKFHSDEENISQIVPTGNIQVIHIEVMNDKMFHLLNRQQEITFYVIVGPHVVPLETLTVRNTGFRIINSASNISCVDHMHGSISESNSDSGWETAGLIVGSVVVTAIVAVSVIIILCVYYFIAKHCKATQDPSPCIAQPTKVPVADGKRDIESDNLQQPAANNEPLQLVNFNEEPSAQGFRQQHNNTTELPEDFPETFQLMDPVQASDNDTSIPPPTSTRPKPDGQL
ncbi:uncharacterized protein [Dysidea avara]|uniref:uncharacterized protein n=1 Tax=Dysidea avara TaxID=196820 RepID=UPI003321BD3F